MKFHSAARCVYNYIYRKVSFHLFINEPVVEMNIERKGNNNKNENAPYNFVCTAFVFHFFFLSRLGWSEFIAGFTLSVLSPNSFPRLSSHAVSLFLEQIARVNLWRLDAIEWFDAPFHLMSLNKCNRWFYVHSVSFVSSYWHWLDDWCGFAHKIVPKIDLNAKTKVNAEFETQFIRIKSIDVVQLM